MIEISDEMRAAFQRAAGWPSPPWRFGADVADGLAAVLAIVERDQPHAKAGDGEDACGKLSPDGKACERRARHDVCVAWVSGGSDAWVVDYDDMANRIAKLEGAFEVASSSRSLWRQRALDAGWKR